MKKIILPLALLLLFFTGISSAQNMSSKRAGMVNSGPGTVTGKVLDSASLKAIDYASIAIFKENSTRPLNGAVSNSDGDFSIKNIPVGLYKLKITFMGYYNKEIDSIKITNSEYDIELGKILINQKSLQLKGVEVTAQRGPIEFQVDKMVVSVEKTLPSAGGSVLDVLKNTPSVSVDVDGNVSLRGNGNITFLLDGRPSGMIDPKMLEQIPASAIENIEIVTNPSAKYDADGTAGIINFIMKKQKEMNWNGLFQINAGTRDNYGSSANVNFKKEDLNLYATYDDRFSNREMNGSTNRWTNIPSQGLNYIDQDINQNRRNSSHNFKFGLDYNLNKFNAITTSVLFNIGSNNRSSQLANTTSDSSRNILSKYKTNNSGSGDGQSFDYLLNYKRTFEKKGEELTADFYYTISNNNDDNDRIISYILPANHVISDSLSFNAPVENTYTSNKNRLFSFQTDYALPINDNGKFESGYKGIFRDRDINYNVLNKDGNNWVNDLTQSNVFSYQEQIHAIYGLYSDQIGGFKYQLGLRLEEALTKSFLANTNSEYKKNYFSPIPTIHLSQEVISGQGIKLSYSRRLNRPQMWALNPFLRYEDPQSAFQGNPYLKPEYTDSYEAGYNFIFKSSSIFANAFYKQVNDNINHFIEVNNDNVTIQTFKNIDKQIQYGLELNGYSQLYTWWTINGSISYYASKFKGESYSNTNSINDVWNGRFMTMVSLGWDLDFQLNCFYASRNLSPQGKTKSMFFSDVALKKSLFEKKLTISFRVSDPFNAIKFRNQSFGTNFSAETDFKPTSQIFSLSLSYSMNNFKKIFERKPDEDSGSHDYDENGQQR